MYINFDSDTSTVPRQTISYYIPLETFLQGRYNAGIFIVTIWKVKDLRTFQLLVKEKKIKICSLLSVFTAHLKGETPDKDRCMPW